jgi:hypothetical protein
VGRLTAACLRTWSGDSRRSWSLAALLAGAFGAACAGVVIAAQADDLWSLNWPLILVPALVVPLPLLVPLRAVRVGAAVAMGIWCWLASASIGLFFVPCLFLMILAAKREDA